MCSLGAALWVRNLDIISSRQSASQCVSNDLSAPHPRHSVAQFWHNVDVQRRTRLPNVLEVIPRRRHTLCVHVRRLDPSTPAHAALRLRVDSRRGIRPRGCWRRPVGRQRRSWISQQEYLPGSCGRPWRTAGVDGWTTLRRLTRIITSSSSSIL